MKPFNKLYLIAGVPKAATTTLEQSLRASKFLRFPYRKELYYLCKQTKAINKGVYHPPVMEERKYISAFSSFNIEYPAIDADPHSFQDLLAAQEALQLADNVKAVVILRNPIHRYLSHYFMDRRTYYDLRPLSVTITTDLSSQPELPAIERRYLWHSTYAPWIKLWKDALGANNVLFVRYEAIANHALPFSAQIITFFEADDLLGVNLFKNQINTSHIVRSNFSRFLLQYRVKHSYLMKLYMLFPQNIRQQIWKRILFKPGREFEPQLSDRIRLRDHMADDIRETGELLGWNVDDWLSVESKPTFKFQPPVPHVLTSA